MMSGPRLAVGGLYLCYKIFREIVRRTTGVPAQAPFIASIFAVGVVANGLRPLLAPLFRALRPRSPWLRDPAWAIVFPAAIVRATGVAAKDTPLVGASIGLGLVPRGLHTTAALERMVSSAFAALGRAGQPGGNVVGKRRNDA
jgi:hypothetical protein